MVKQLNNTQLFKFNQGLANWSNANPKLGG